VTRALLAAGAGAALVLGGALAAADPEPAPALRLVEAARVPGQPVQVVEAPDGRLLVVGQEGTVRLLQDPARPLLDVRDRVAFGGEQGLLGLAFHPRGPADRRLYLHYTDRGGDTRVVEYVEGPAGPRPVRTLLEVDQPHANHNGGNLVFGADGRLYLGLGDGGDAFDPDDRSQDPASALGKLLRLDVDRPDAAWEVVARGLRNPWRLSVDPRLGDLWIADVGQDLAEEIDRLPAGRRALADLGWPRHEGDRLHAGRRRGAPAPYVAPEHVYGRALGCSVAGGPVLRAGPLPLAGRYLYGDLCSGRLWSFPVDADGKSGAARAEDAAVPGLVSVDATRGGRLLLTSLYGYVYEVVPG
jgi:glucose/arabinose dehydrogenase